MPLRILWRAGAAAGEAARRAPDLLETDALELIVERDRERAAARMEGVRVLVDGSPSPALLDAPDLERVVVPWAGVPDALREALRERPRLALHNSHFNARFVAQHALALLLAAAHRIPEADRALKRGDWRPRWRDGFHNVDLLGRTALLVGYGAIGRALEPMLRGLGMEVEALRSRPDPDAPLRQWGRERAREAFARADAAVVSLPGTAATEGLVGAEELGAMPRGSLLVNVGRGPVVDAAALHAALLEGRLAGAGLDVWWRYPEDEAARASTPPAAPPLHELPNVVASPHRADAARDADAAAFEDVLETLRAVRDGRERSRVDPGRGY